MPSPRPQTLLVHPLLVFVFAFTLSSLGFIRVAAAEKIIANGDGWQLYTDGRAGAFLSYVNGDGYPQPTYGLDATNMQVQLHDVRGGGFNGLAEREQTPNGLTQGTINSMRVRSGFISNTLGIGVREQISPTTSAMAYIQIWAFVESESRQKNRPNYGDVRQGYGKIEGPWGSLLAGRSRALFSRGATDINVLYAHRYGVGFPGDLDSYGPTLGHIGFGVLGSGFAAGLAYATPVLGGFQLTVGGYDPIQLQGAAWVRTKYVRPEAEATFERALGQMGKIVLFANGAYQQVYKGDVCAEPPCVGTAAGFGYGGRLELGPVRLGVAGHYGQGLGLNYALEVSDASLDPVGTLRKFDGYYAQSMLVLGKVNISAGWGIVRVFLTDQDNATVPDPRDPLLPQIIPHSVIKHQMGASAGIVYHLTPSIHFDMDFFRAEAAWFLGEKQVVYVGNTGMMYTW